jgi:hypothetical protein
MVVPFGQVVAHPAAGAVKAGADRAERHVEGTGDLGVLEIAPRPQQERLALVGGEAGQGRGDLWAEELLLQVAVDSAVGRAVGEGAGPGSDAAGA